MELGGKFVGLPFLQEKFGEVHFVLVFRQESLPIPRDLC